MNTFVCVHLSKYFFRKYLGVELLSHTYTYLKLYCITSNYFPKCIPKIFLTPSLSLQHVVWPGIFSICSLVSMLWYLIVSLLSISLITDKAQYLSYVYCQFGFTLLKSWFKIFACFLLYCLSFLHLFIVVYTNIHKYRGHFISVAYCGRIWYSFLFWFLNCW